MSLRKVNRLKIAPQNVVLDCIIIDNFQQWHSHTFRFLCVIKIIISEFNMRVFIRIICCLNFSKLIDMISVTE